MAKTDVFLQDSGDRRYVRQRKFRMMLRDLQSCAECYNIDLVLFVEDSDDSPNTGADMSFDTCKPMGEALGTCPGMEDENKIAKVGFL